MEGDESVPSTCTQDAPASENGDPDPNEKKHFVLFMKETLKDDEAVFRAFFRILKAFNEDQIDAPNAMMGIKLQLSDYPELRSGFSKFLLPEAIDLVKILMGDAAAAA
ncbi:hypothetical protein R1flu_010157 [Riccia fluitans]|uniref:Uncharacterized protein n=1 Tax=Riccia fluitans TaxID=41844 RepID=A0ABD1Z470_9MARC